MKLEATFVHAAVKAALEEVGLDVIKAGPFFGLGEAKKSMKAAA